MNPQLAAVFAAHKTAILGAAAAGVAGLALLQRKKGAAVPAGAAPASVAGTIPAAAVAPAQAPDNSAYDVYNALQSELEPLLQTGTGGITTAPAPVASTLFAPTRSGNYVYNFEQGNSNPAVYEAESDGSLYFLNPTEWGAIDQAGNHQVPVSQLPANLGTPFYSLQGNLSAANKGSGPTVFTTDAQGHHIPYSPKS